MQFLTTLPHFVGTYFEHWCGAISFFKSKGRRNRAIIADDGIPILFEGRVHGVVWDGRFPFAGPFVYSDQAGTFEFDFRMQNCGRGFKTVVLDIGSLVELVTLQMLCQHVVEFHGYNWRTYEVAIRCSGHYARQQDRRRVLAEQSVPSGTPHKPLGGFYISGRSIKFGSAGTIGFVERWDKC